MTPLTLDQALLVSAYTGFLIVSDFGQVHEYVEKVMGRSVWTHEFAEKSFREELKEKLKPDFLLLVPDAGGKQ
jgi:hypothetical protein